MMFTIFSLRNSTPFESDEREAILRVIDDYCRTSAGEWLRNFPYRRFSFHWCAAMSEDVMGAFVPAAPWTIFLMPCAENGTTFSRTTWAEIMAPTAIHELRHAWQFRKCCLLYVLCSLPILRQFTLERDATRIGNAAAEIIEKTVAWHDARRFARRWKREE